MLKTNNSNNNRVLVTQGLLDCTQSFLDELQITEVSSRSEVGQCTPHALGAPQTALQSISHAVGDQ